MKQLTIYSLFFLSVTLSGTAFAQYSVTPSFDITTFSEIFFHGVPDSIHNHLDYGITVEIKRFDSGTTFQGLQRHTGPSTIKYSKDLDSKSVKALNLKQLRTPSSDPQKKRIDLIITVPKELAHRDWGISNSVKWKLGENHEPSYTLIRKVKATGEFEIVFVYENGVPPITPNEEQFIKNNNGIFRKHIQAHFCGPLDTGPTCQ